MYVRLYRAFSVYNLNMIMMCTYVRVRLAGPCQNVNDLYTALDTKYGT